MIGKNINNLNCELLSKKNCDRVASCEYNDTKNRCMKRGHYAKFLWEESEKWRSKAIELLKDRKDCNITDILSNAKIFSSAEKNSASDTVIASGFIRPSGYFTENPEANVIIKISADSKDPLDNQLQVEEAIYKEIINNFITNNITPGVASYLGTLKCNDIRFNNARLQHTIDSFMVKRPNQSLNLVFLEKLRGQIIHSWLYENVSNPSYLAVIFILIYTLACFQYVGLVHNDLHFGNIYVEKLDKQIEMDFHIGRRIIRLRTKYIPKIYDFDRATIINPAVPYNFFMDRHTCAFSRGNRCGIPNINVDPFTLMFLLLEYFDKSIVYHMSNQQQPNRNEIKDVIHKEFFYKFFDKHWIRDYMEDAEADSEAFAHMFTGNFANIKSTQADVLLEMFLNADWGINSPFEEMKELDPDALTFTLPSYTELFIDFDYPSTSKIYRGLRNKDYNEIIRKLRSQYLIEDEEQLLEVYRVAKDKEKALFAAWEKTLPTEYDLSTTFIELYDRAKMIKPIIQRLRRLYMLACNYLCYPQFHLMTSKMKNKVFGIEMFIIEDIWTIFQNNLPVQIPFYKMAPLGYVPKQLLEYKADIPEEEEAPHRYELPEKSSPQYQQNYELPEIQTYQSLPKYYQSPQYQQPFSSPKYQEEARIQSQLYQDVNLGNSPRVNLLDSDEQKRMDAVRAALDKLPKLNSDEAYAYNLDEFLSSDPELSESYYRQEKEARRANRNKK